jgi:hypothetical protein
MQKNHSTLSNAEYDTGDLSLRQTAPDLPEAPTERATQGHPERPAEFDSRDVEAHDPTILFRQSPQPILDRLRAADGSVEEGRNSLQRNLECTVQGTYAPPQVRLQGSAIIVALVAREMVARFTKASRECFTTAILLEPENE